MKASIFAVCLTFVACADEFAPASRLEGARVLAVVADQPFAKPGATVQLDMLALSQDGTPLEIAWFPGCENPAGDQASRCLDTLDTTIALGDTHYELPISADIISRRPATPGNTPKYGLAYVYFAVCAGTLVNVDPPRLGFGVDCVDAGGNSLGAQSFVVGYTPIYVYDEVTNANPQMIDVVVADTVAACDEKDVDDCPDVDILVYVDPSQVEEDFASVALGEGPVKEILWTSFFVTSGEMVSDTRLIADGGTFRDPDDSRGKWHVEPGYRGPAQVYVVLRDSRGGSSWVRRDVTIE